MSAFQAVNTPLSAPPAPKEEEVKTPTTPRPNQFFSALPATETRSEDASAKTPTKASFAGLTEQPPRTEPSVTFGHEPTKSEERVTTGNKRESLHRPSKSVDSIDTAMLEDEEGAEGSDNDSTTDDGNRPSKKKKGQRFFCTDFPPCQLSFTRSEHLARHIRKHTGERPFQCHCNRRFSRLDNLRQHAQTVHVNEDIPGDSLAATGTRFQRQIRTDRVRPPSSRSRASTLGSQGSHSRGHSRNLSTSSIASTSSTLSQRDDSRRRPPPLAMANDPAARARLSLETFPANTGSPGNQFQGFSSNSASGFSTPTSATFSQGTGSPMFTPGLQSPVSAPRPVTWGGERTPGRRLSVPSGAPLFQAHMGTSPYNNAAYGSQVQSSASSVYSGNGSVMASPTSSVFSDTRRDSNVEADWRRRTWHPGIYQALMQRPATSGLSYHQTPDAPAPALAPTSQPAANQTRLPGIESFDRFSNGNPPPPALIRRQPSPMQVDSSPQHPTGPRPLEPSATTREERRQKHISWDFALRKGFNELDIANATPPKEPPQWLQQQSPSNHAVQAARPTTAPHPSFAGQQTPMQHPLPAMPPQPSDPRSVGQESPDAASKGQPPAWFNGPQHAFQTQPPAQPVQPLQPSFQPRPTSHGYVMQRTSPEDSSSSEGVPTPGTSTVSEYHPAILHSNGYVEPHRPLLSGEESSQNKAPPPPSSHAPGPPTYSHPAEARAPVSLSFQPGPTIIESQPPPGPSAPGQTHDMRRLEALVAVATGENVGVTARP